MKPNNLPSKAFWEIFIIVEILFLVLAVINELDVWCYLLSPLFSSFFTVIIVIIHITLEETIFKR